jgi:prophage antirepressor-like protein
MSNIGKHESNDLAIFNYENHKVRAVFVNEEPWWVLKDICNALEIKNASQAARRLDDDEKSMSDIRLKTGIPAIIVSESGLYGVIQRSNKPGSRRFRKWVEEEMIPSIRKQTAEIKGEDAMGDARLFNSAEFGDIRTSAIDGKPYAADANAARTQTYAYPSQAVGDHGKGIVKLPITLWPGRAGS